jgi:hypothetical protein
VRPQEKSGQDDDSLEVLLLARPDTGDDLDEASLGKVGDADKLDGKDSAAFWTGKSYRLTSEETDGGADGTGTAQSVFCDIGDSATGGGYAGLSPSEGTVTRTVPIDLVPVGGKQEGWTSSGRTTGRRLTGTSSYTPAVRT